MTTGVSAGASIEGDVVDGSSRSELANKGRTIHNGIRCSRYVASDDVMAQVTTALSPGVRRLSPNANTASGDSVLAAKVTIHTLASKARTNVENRSGRHKANGWHFSAQTSVDIDYAKQAIANSVAKRVLVVESEPVGELSTASDMAPVSNAELPGRKA